MSKISIPTKEALYVTKEYGDCSKYYYMPIFKNFYLKRIQMMIDLMEGNGHSVLDIGYGSGILFYEFKKRFFDLYGVDLRKDAGHIKRMLSKHGIKVNLINGSLCNLPYKNNTFDYITDMSVLEHISELEKPVEEVKRILKKGGSFICGFPVKNFYMHQFFRLINFDDKKDHPSSHIYIYDMLKKVFNIDKIIKFPFFLKMDQCLYIACRCKKNENSID